MSDWMGRVVLFLVVGMGGVCSLHYTTGHFKSDRQLILLNTTRPDFQKLIDLEKQQITVVPRRSLKEYFDYFHLVTAAMPESSEGNLILGYLDEITGDKKQAQFYFKKAYQLDPSFFFTDYNLALSFFEQGDDVQSAALLQKALEVAPELTFKGMMNSVIYRQFLSSIKDSRDIIVSLQQAYHDAYVLLIESTSQRGENGGPQVHAHIM